MKWRYKTSNYTKIYEAGSWGYRFYLTEQDFKDLKTQSPLPYDVVGKKLKFCDGQKVRIKWPNGKKTTETLRVRRETEHVCDHGKSESVTNEIPYILTKVSGKSVETTLGGLEICLEDIKKE